MATLKNWARLILLSVVTGLISGTVATLFLFALNFATQTRVFHPFFIWLMPVAGLITGLVYHQWGKSVVRGTPIIIEEIHSPQKKIPLRKTPLIFFTATLAHLTGASIGREGALVQMAASLADQIAHFFKTLPTERRALLVAGMGAGFGAGIGTPLAGTIFGLEVIRKKPAISEFAMCLITAFVGYTTTLVLCAPHTHYPKVNNVMPDRSLVVSIIALGVMSGLVAKAFIFFTACTRHIVSRVVPHEFLRPVFGGTVLALLYAFENSGNYAGLGLAIIQDRLLHPAQIHEFFFKILFTALAVGSGFKGGEFVPLVFAGTTLGSALSFYTGSPTLLLASAGFPAVFAAASKTPITCTLMAMELFGYSIGPWALLCSLLAGFTAGKKGIFDH